MTTQPVFGGRIEAALGLAAMAACIVVCGGCAVLAPGHAPGEILTLREPDTGQEYHLYVPSNYTAEREWPLVVACHGHRPLDWPKAQVDEWKGLAESRGFLVAAPALASATATVSRDPGRDIAALRRDEDGLVAVVAHVRGARSVDANAVFLTGWLGGARAALFAGLKNPDVFRAIVLRQPLFDARSVEPCRPFMDHQQPIHVIYGPTDFARNQALECVTWLRQERMLVSEAEMSGAYKREPEPAYQFLREVVRSRPWIRVLVTEVDPAEPLAAQFSLRSSVPIDQYLWEFGDGKTSRIASPSHVYDVPGTYTIRVVAMSGKKSYVRRIEIRVPRVRMGTSQPTP